jgi:hypothetical protein
VRCCALDQAKEGDGMLIKCSHSARCGAAKLLLDPFEKDFDMTLARPTARSVRLNGFATCLRLERVYWNILETLATAIGARSTSCCPTWTGKCTCGTAA